MSSRILGCILLTAALTPAAPGASMDEPVILQVVFENQVQYCGNVTDYTKLASEANRVDCSLRTFGRVIGLSDVVSVNGRPAKGSMTFSATSTNMRSPAAAGQAIGDAVRNGPAFDTLELLHPDGTPVGSLMAVGMVGGSAPPGSPAEIMGGNMAVVGGTGPFLGAYGLRGANMAAPSTPQRNASMSEDPSNRRTFGGGTSTTTWYIFPRTRPEIVMTNSGPAVVHGRDYSVVTAANPASADEIVILYATCLGPVSGPMSAGMPFPSNPLARVNSPVEVLVNGTPAEVLAAVGFPGSTDRYQVNFRMPAGIRAGTAQVRVVSAWIPGPPVAIAVK